MDNSITDDDDIIEPKILDTNLAIDLFNELKKNIKILGLNLLDNNTPSMEIDFIDMLKEFIDIN